VKLSGQMAIQVRFLMIFGVKKPKFSINYEFIHEIMLNPFRNIFFFAN